MEVFVERVGILFDLIVPEFVLPGGAVVCIALLGLLGIEDGVECNLVLLVEFIEELALVNADGSVSCAAGTASLPTVVTSIDNVDEEEEEEEIVEDTFSAVMLVVVAIVFVVATVEDDSLTLVLQLLLVLVRLLLLHVTLLLLLLLIFVLAFSVKLILLFKTLVFGLFVGVAELLLHNVVVRAVVPD